MTVAATFPELARTHGLGDVAFPSFFIIGAMKAGTTSLHRLLDRHPSIHVPPGEAHLFDIDDRLQHPDFGMGSLSRHYRFDRDLPVLLPWYADRYRDAPAGALVGEDSTTYLASRDAVPRIEQHLPGAKYIVLLRDPIKRAQSHYWHMVRRGYYRRSFERTLHETPDTILQRGFYREQLQHLYDTVPPDRVDVRLFEHFVADQQSVLDGLLRFLGVDGTLDVADQPVKANVARVWRWPAAQRQFRRLYTRPRERYRDRWPEPLVPTSIEQRPFDAGRHHPLLDRIDRRLSTRGYPSMDRQVQRELAALYRGVNQGLDDLLGVDLTDVWPWWRDR